MNAVAQLLTIVEGLALATVGVLQAFSFRDQRFRPIFLIRPEDTEAVRLWAIDVGFGNLAWAVGAFTGVLLVNLGLVGEGRTIVIFVSIAMIVLGFVLLFSELRLWRNATAQVALPVAVLVAMSF
jgi:hypothetical protein